MIQRLATLLITLYISISLQAQDKKKPGFTKEEFRARQEAYLTQKAEITQEEATKFFPIYFELQDRKKTVNDKAWEQARKGKNPKTTDAEYEQIIEGIKDTSQGVSFFNLQSVFLIAGIRLYSGKEEKHEQKSKINKAYFPCYDGGNRRSNFTDSSSRGNVSYGTFY